MYYLGRMFPERKQDAVEQPPAKFFGVSLETGVAQSGGAEGGALVPLPVTQMIQYLEANGGLQREGLFRVGGNKTERKELMECWKRGQQNMPSDVDGAADLLKHYFLELPESLIPESHYLGTVHCSYYDSNTPVSRAKKCVVDVEETGSYRGCGGGGLKGRSRRGRSR